MGVLVAEVGVDFFAEVGVDFFGVDVLDPSEDFGVSALFVGVDCGANDMIGLGVSE